MRQKSLLLNLSAINLFKHKRAKNIYPNLAVSGFIIANCILLRVTSNGYENDCAIAPAKPPAKSFAGNFKTRPPAFIHSK